MKVDRFTHKICPCMFKMFLAYLTPKIWLLIPRDFKDFAKLNIFKSKIKNWSTSGCPCVLCKTFSWPWLFTRSRIWLYGDHNLFYFLFLLFFVLERMTIVLLKLFRHKSLNISEIIVKETRIDFLESVPKDFYLTLVQMESFLLLDWNFCWSWYTSTSIQD